MQWPASSSKRDMPKRLDELFAAEPDRLSRLSFDVGGILFRLVEDPSRRRR